MPFQPDKSLFDVGFFHLIVIAAIGDVFGLQAKHLVMRKRCRAVELAQFQVQFQKLLGISRIISVASSSIISS